MPSRARAASTSSMASSTSRQTSPEPGTGRLRVRRDLTARLVDVDPLASDLQGTAPLVEADLAGAQRAVERDGRVRIPDRQDQVVDAPEPHGDSVALEAGAVQPVARP